ncbi:MAG: hypothetical protein KBG28_26255 [Kofleriaceae bacterium]|mgnify:CR=1 FL=1|jgi:hypothetical protein|nr:hypothetical protein [Kofleriaceae bacterium]MBP6836454.1 hypothetical protein [Kofleriaceae bacterium]MBP9207497.1 hypothetical protein [Kofleriaceae bacterium]
MAGALFPIILAIVIGVLAALAGWMPFSPFVGVVVLTLLIGPVLGLIEMIKSMERGTHTPGESH